MVALMVSQLKEFKRFMKKFTAADEKMEEIFERGDFPTEKEEKEFENLQTEYSDFMEFFRTYDANYWDNMSLTDVAEMIIKENGGI